MLIDGLKISDSAVIENARVQAGPSFPATPVVGLMFYLDAAFADYQVGLYVYNGTDWATGDVESVTAGIGLVGGGGAGDIELSVDGTYVALQSDLAATDSNVTNLTNAHNAHAADMGVHMTAGQNTLLDGIEGQVSAAEINHLAGVTGGVQSQIDSEIAARVAADNTLQNNVDAEATARTSADATLQSNITSEETRALAAEGSLATDLAAETSRATASEAALTVRMDNEETARGDADTALQANITGAVTNHATDKASQTNKDATQDASIAEKLPKAGGSMSGDISMAGNSITSVGTPVDPADAANKSYVDNLVSGVKWKDPVRAINLIDDQRQVPPSAAEKGDVYIVKGPASAGWAAFSGGDIVQFNGTGTPDLAGSWSLVQSGPVATGDRFVVSGSTVTPATAPFLEGTVVTWDGAQFDVVAPNDAESVYVGDPDSINFGQSFVYSTEATKWVQFTGPAQVGAGTGLSYDGNTMNVGLGAGIAELPSDEIGIDLRGTGGLMLTQDGATDSVDGPAQLAVRIDGPTLSVGVDGLRVAQPVLDDISANAAAVTAEESARQTADTGLSNRIDAEEIARQGDHASAIAAVNAEESRATTAEANITATINANKAAADAHAADETRHLNSFQNTLLDGLVPTLTSEEINHLDGVSGNVQGQIDTEATARTLADSTLQSGIDNEASARSAGDAAIQANVDVVVSDLAAHGADGSKHLTVAQNTLLDGIAATVTSVEVNYLDGVTSPLQTQINNINTGIGGDVDAHAADTALHLSSDQNTFLDGIDFLNVGFAEVNFLQGLTSNAQTQIDAGVSAHSSHAADASLHLTAEQNTLLDGISGLISSSEINYLDGLTSNIQTQINGEISARTAADASLQSQIDAEEGTRAGAVTNLQGQIDDADAAIAAHAADDSRHLTPSQNTLLDGIAATVTSIEINHLDGVTAGIQGQIDGEISARQADTVGLQTSIDTVNGDLQSHKAAYTAADVLAKLKTVDGAGSGLDADTLDGKSSASFVLTTGKAADSNKLDGIDSTGFIRLSADATMQSGKHISMNMPTLAAHGASKAYVDQEITNLLGGAPGNLDTLNELAAALNDDANLATTLTSDIAAHAADDSRHLTPSQNTLLDGIAATVTSIEINHLDGVTSGIQGQIDGEISSRQADTAAVQTNIDNVDSDLQSHKAAYTAADVLAKLKTVDGAGSGLDADTLDGKSSASFLLATGKAVDSNKLDGIDSTGFVRLSADATMQSGKHISMNMPTLAAHGASKAYVDQEITNLLGGAPGNLDTLNELAAALNDDANLATTLTSDIATKLSKSGGTMTGYITLHNAPSSVNHAATKGYVDSSIASFASETPKNVTASMTASAGDVLFCDHAGAITVTLPASPSFNDTVEFVMIGSNGTLTVARNGQDIMSLAENMTVNTADASFKLRYFNATHGWRVVGA